MSEANSSDQDRIMQILFPYARPKFDALRRDASRLVHYTSAEVAVSIIRDKKVWMRSSTSMNDFMEVEHGLNCLSHAYRETSAGKELQIILDTIDSKIRPSLEATFDAWQPGLRYGTFMTCVSEHLDSEDSYGRLSMWRAYGGRNGVALVMNSSAFALHTNALSAYSSPVLYAEQEKFNGLLANVVANMQREIEFLKQLETRALHDALFNMFRFAALCTKHPGFEEELEWRVIYCPALEASDKLEKSVQVIRGMPQIVYKIPLQDYPEEGLTGLAIPQLIDRIIIGPTEHPREMSRAFVHLLEEAGVENPSHKVFISDIPLRQGW